MEDSLLVFFIATFFPLIFGLVIFVTNSILPVISFIFGLGTIRGKRSLWGLFLSFVVSFTFFRILLSVIVKETEISFNTLQDGGIFFLTLFGMMWILPQFSLWHRVEDDFQKGIVYGGLLGFLWSFWVGLFKAIPSDYYEPKWIGFLEIYLTLISSIGPGILLVGIGFILSKLYPNQHIRTIEKGLGFLALLISVLLMLHILTITPREGLKPKEPAPIPLYKLFER